MAINRRASIALLTALVFCGCASSGSKQGAAADESQTQTADTRQVILVPVVIMPAPDEDPTVEKRSVTPDAAPPDHPADKDRAQHSGGSVKL